MAEVRETHDAHRLHDGDEEKCLNLASLRQCSFLDPPGQMEKAKGQETIWDHKSPCHQSWFCSWLLGASEKRKSGNRVPC